MENNELFHFFFPVLPSYRLIHSYKHSFLQVCFIRRANEKIIDVAEVIQSTIFSKVTLFDSQAREAASLLSLLSSLCSL